MTDEQLIQAVRGGDHDSLGVLVTRWQQPLLRFVSRMLPRQEDARDVCQETFLRILKKSHRFKTDARFSTWMYQIALNLCRDHQRRKSKRWRLLVTRSRRRCPSVPGDDARERRHGRLDPALAAESERDAARCCSASPWTRASRPSSVRSLVLKEFEGLKFREIAEILGCPESTVKSRMYYGLEWRSAASWLAPGITAHLTHALTENRNDVLVNRVEPRLDRLSLRRGGARPSSGPRCDVPPGGLPGAVDETLDESRRLPGTALATGMPPVPATPRVVVLDASVLHEAPPCGPLPCGPSPRRRPAVRLLGFSISSGGLPGLGHVAYRHAARPAAATLGGRTARSFGDRSVRRDRRAGSPAGARSTACSSGSSRRSPRPATCDSPAGNRDRGRRDDPGPVRERADTDSRAVELNDARVQDVAVRCCAP